MSDTVTAATSLPDAPASGAGGALPSADGEGEEATTASAEGKQQNAKKPAKRKTPPSADSKSPSPGRAPSSPKKKKKKKKSPPSAGVDSSATLSKKRLIASSGLASPSVPPSRTLVVDNGGDTVKYGWAASNGGRDGSTNSDAGAGADGKSSPPTPATMPNLTARLPQQWTVLVGDQLLSQKFRNPNSLLSVTRSTERGVVTNLGNQLQVWKRMLDLLRVSIPLHTETAKAFGWKAPSAVKGPTSHGVKPALSSNSSQPKATSTGWIPAGGCAVLLTVPPFCPRNVLDQMASVWLHDFGFSRVGFACPPAAASLPCLMESDNPYGSACVVDVGWSATHVVPTVASSESAKSSSQREVVRAAVRRLPVGGRHLINLWKYQTTYRQWNLMDQEFLLKDVLERTGEVTLRFDEWMKLAARVPPGKRPYDREYVLPDFVQTFQGEVRLPRALLDLQKRSEERGSRFGMAAEQGDDDDDDDDDEDDDSDVDENEMNKLGDGDDEEAMSDGGRGTKVKSRNNDNDDASIDDDEEETPDQIRRRLLKQKEEEERRRREEEAEQQVLNLSVERFAIPEALFRPSDVGLAVEWAGLPETIVQSILACPKHFQPALYKSIYLVGGLSQLPGLKDRLERELRTLVPCDLDVAITAGADPINQAWHGARQLVLDLPPETWSIGRDAFTDCESSSKSNKCKSSAWRSVAGNGRYLV